jgi:hypothetical protein
VSTCVIFVPGTLLKTFKIQFTSLFYRNVDMTVYLHTVKKMELYNYAKGCNSLQFYRQINITLVEDIPLCLKYINKIK